MVDDGGTTRAGEGVVGVVAGAVTAIGRVEVTTVVLPAAAPTGATLIGDVASSGLGDALARTVVANVFRVVTTLTLRTVATVLLTTLMVSDGHVRLTKIACELAFPEKVVEDLLVRLPLPLAALMMSEAYT